MGACLSCLGLDRRSSDDEPSEADRLLYDENATHRNGYGAAGQGANVPAPDPEELRRHREMLERICAETADNLIDVQHTNLLTLRGKPSAEFTKLLNTHFAATSKLQTDIEPPKTPNHNLPSSPPEPPSPFTQAQLQAAAQNGRTTSATATSTFATIAENGGASDPQTPQKSQSQKPSSQSSPETSADTGTGTGTGTKNTSQSGDDGLPDEDAAEEQWLASVGAKDQALERWDEIQPPAASLVVDLSGEEPDGHGGKGK